MLIYGRSMKGKSTFIRNIILNKHLKVDPKFFIFVFQTDNEENMQEKLKPFVDAVVETYHPFDEYDDAIIAISLDALDSTLLELRKKYPANPPKLLIIEDVMTEKMPKEIMSVLNDKCHHDNLCAMITNQQIYQRNGRWIRDCVQTIALFGGASIRSFKTFIKEYPPAAQATIRSHFSEAKANQEREKYDDNVVYIDPIIIDREGTSITIYCGLDDDDPLIVNELDNPTKDDVKTTRLANDFIRERAAKRRREDDNNDHGDHVTSSSSVVDIE